MLAKALCNGDRIFFPIGAQVCTRQQDGLDVFVEAELARWQTQTEEDEKKALMLDGKKEKEK